MKLSKSLEEGICPPTRQGDRVRPATEVLYHRRVAMSSKKWRELLGFGDSRLPGVRGRSAEEAIRQIGGTESFRRVFSGGGSTDRIVGWQLGDWAVTVQSQLLDFDGRGGR